MPNDTKYIVNGAQLTDIGSAIRSKLGEQDTYTVDEMPGKISEIGGGGGRQVVLDTTSFNSSVDSEAQMAWGEIQLTDAPSLLGTSSIYVTYDGEEYALPYIEIQEYHIYGYGEADENGPSYENYPIFMMVPDDNFLVIYTSEAGEHEIKIEIEAIIPQGTIDITEEGMVNVAQYAIANVQLSGYNIPYCEVFLINQTSNTIPLGTPLPQGIMDDNDRSYCHLKTTIGTTSGDVFYPYHILLDSAQYGNGIFVLDLSTATNVSVRYDNEVNCRVSSVYEGKYSVRVSNVLASSSIRFTFTPTK